MLFEDKSLTSRHRESLIEIEGTITSSKYLLDIYTITILDNTKHSITLDLPWIQRFVAERELRKGVHITAEGTYGIGTVFIPARINT